MNQEQQQQSSRPSEVGNITAQSIQTDIMLFKDEVLRDLKKAELQMKGRIDKHNIENEKRTKVIEVKVEMLMKELTNMMELKSSNNSKMDEINKLQSFKQSTEDKLLSLEYNVNSAVRDISNACYKYDKLIQNNILIPGVVGDNCKYPNMKELLQYIFMQLSALNNFKDKQQIDLKSYKEKLEGLMTNFNRSIEKVKANFIDHCKESVQESERNFTTRIALTDQLVEDLRLENSTYSRELKKESQQCKIDFDKLLSMKEEIFQQFNDKILEYKTESKATSEDVKKFQNEFAVIKLKFTELSDFIKDVRFRRNAKQDLSKRDTNEMSKKINFDLKTTRKHIDDERLKECILNNKTIANDYDNKELNSSRRNSYSRKDMSNYSPSHYTKDNQADLEDEILMKNNLNELTDGSNTNTIHVRDDVLPLVKQKMTAHRMSVITNTSPCRKKDIVDVKYKRNTVHFPVNLPEPNTVFNDTDLTLDLMKNDSKTEQKEESKPKPKVKPRLDPEDNVMITNIQGIEPSSPQHIKRFDKRSISPQRHSPKKITIRGNQQLASSPIPLIENTIRSKESIDAMNKSEFKSTLKIHEIKQLKGTQFRQNHQTNANVMNDITQSIYLNQNILRESNKPNTLATSSPDCLNTPNQEKEEENDKFDIKPQTQSRNQQTDNHPCISTNKLLKHKKNALSSNPSLTQQLFHKPNIQSKMSNFYLTSMGQDKPSSCDNVKDISDRLLIVEMRMKKLDINMKEMVKYLKTYLIHLEGKCLKTCNCNPSTKLKLINNPAGLFVPFTFNDRNIEDYFPETSQRRACLGFHSKSQDERKRISKDVKYEPVNNPSLLSQRKQPMPIKVSAQFKPLSDDFKQTFSALSVLFTNKPKVIPNENNNLLLKSIHPYTSREQDN